MGLETLVKGGKMCTEFSRNQSLEDSLDKPYSDGIREALDNFQYNFVITDPCLSNHPIVYASEGFLKMTGYSKEEVLGRNARFLQGPDTDRRTVLEIREAIREEKPCQVSILNYRKDRTTFWNLFHLAPVFSREDGRVVHFIGVQSPISKGSRSPRSTVIDSIACSRPKSCPACVGNRLFNHHTSNGDLSNHLICFGSCRRELFRDFSVDLGHSGLYNSNVEEDIRGLEEAEIDAKESEKQKAIDAVTNVLSELTHFSKYTGRTVSDTKCNSADLVRVAPICSSLLIALNRIQQSFVLSFHICSAQAILLWRRSEPYKGLAESNLLVTRQLFWLKGYSRDEVLGRNCRFLQGPDTDQTAMSQVRQSIEAEQTCTVRILNYRKDRHPFWNLLHTAPVRNASGKIAFYVGVQLDVTSTDQDEHQDKGMTSHMKQLGAVGAVRVAVRSLQDAGPSR